MSKLTLKISLRNGEEKNFPLTQKPSEYLKAGVWHEFLMPHIDRLDEVDVEIFTGDYAAWETVAYHYAEGVTTTGEVEADDFEEDARYKYSWQILLDDKPATYAEVDQSLNCDYWLHIKSPRQTEGDWGCLPLDRIEGRLEIADALYEAAEVDHENGTEDEGLHYGQVLEAIEPILTRTTEFVKTTIDGVTYEFSLSRCADF